MVFSHSHSLAALAVAALVGSTAVSASPAKGQAEITNLVVFGDSYSDNCNVWREGAPANESAAYPFPNCPPPPTGRADGGREWPEWVAIDMGEKEVPPPGGGKGGRFEAKKGQWNVTNWAQSGATCNNTLFPHGVPDLTDQIEMQRVNGSKPDKSSVAAVFIGTNDLALFVSNQSGNPRLYEIYPALPTGTTILSASSCVLGQLRSIHKLGFRRMLVFPVAPLQLAPLYADQGIVTRAIKELALANNALLEDGIEELKKELKDTTIDVFPWPELIHSMYYNPTEYDFKNVTGFCKACDPTRTDCTTCSNSYDYLWFDDLHPTSHAFHILARKVVRFLKGDRKDLISGPN